MREREFKSYLNKHNKSEDYIGYCKKIEEAFSGKDMDIIISSHQNISKVRTKLQTLTSNKNSIDNYMSGLNRYLEFSVSFSNAKKGYSKPQMAQTGLVVYEKMIAKHINDELPFMATEYMIMEGVKNGGDRQELHEIIRVHSMEAAKQVKIEGKPNDLVERILADDSFPIDKIKMQEVMDPMNFIGFAPIQTEEFLANEIQPILDQNQDLIGMDFKLKV